MSGYWVISWPEYESPLTGLQPARSIIMRGWEPTPQDIHDLEAAGATVRYVEAPSNYTQPPPGSDAPTIRIGETTWTPSPVPEPDWDAIQFEHEHSESDDGQDIEISVPYEDEEGNAKTLTLTYTYEYVKTSGVIGGDSDAYLVIDSGDPYKMSTDGAVLEGEVVMTDELQALFDSTHIDGAGNVYGTYSDDYIYLTKNGSIVTSIYDTSVSVAAPIADFDGNVIVPAAEDGLNYGALISSAGDPVWKKSFGFVARDIARHGCAGGDHFYFTTGQE